MPALLLPIPALLLLMAALLPMPALLPLIAALLPMPAVLLPVPAGVTLAGPPLAAFVPAAPAGVDIVDIDAEPPAVLLAVRPAALALAAAPGLATWSLCVVCDSSGTSLLQAASIRTADKTQTSGRWLRGSFTICSLWRGCLTALRPRATPAHRDDAVLGKR
jgi:hypothetical protein